MRTILAAMAGVFIAILAVLLLFVLGREDRTTLAAALPEPEVMAERQAPATDANPMTPVTVPEAERRATLHERLAETTASQVTAVMAPPVVTEVREASADDPLSRRVFGDELPTAPEPVRAPPSPPSRPARPTLAVAAEPVEPTSAALEQSEPEAEPEQVAVEPAPRKINPALYRDRLSTDATRSTATFGVRSLEQGIIGPMEFDSGSLGEALIESYERARRLRELRADGPAVEHASGQEGWFEAFEVAGGLAPEVEAPPGVYVRPQYDVPQLILPPSQPVTGYGGPLPEERSAARPALVGVDPYGNTYTTSDQPNPYLAPQSGPLVLARSGDLLVATLLYGFNSDDVRGLPIYAVVQDYLPNGTRGPLDGARIQGQVAFSTNNAAILFDSAVLADGRELPINAIAVSLETGQTGMAANVDRHLLPRYGSLFLSGIIQGFGEVGLARLADDGGDQPVVVVNEGDGGVSVGRNDDEPSTGDILAGSLAPVGENLSSAAAQGFNRAPTISAPAGLPFAIVFTATLVSEPGQTRTAFNPRTGQVEVIGTIEPSPAPSSEVGGLPGAFADAG